MIDAVNKHGKNKIGSLHNGVVKPV